jgi:hypothetical protein
MTAIAVPALALMQALFAAAPAGAQEPAVHAVMADHAAEVCAPGPQRGTHNGVPVCDAAGNLAQIAVFTEGMQRTEVLIRWVDLAAAPCLRPTPPAPSAPRAGAAPALTTPPPPPPTPETAIAACDGALGWLARFEVALTDDRSRADVAPELLLTLGQAHRNRGEALTAADGGLSARACAAFAAGREAVGRIDMSSWYVRSRSGFPLIIAEVEAAGAACP